MHRRCAASVCERAGRPCLPKRNVVLRGRFRRGLRHHSRAAIGLFLSLFFIASCSAICAGADVPTIPPELRGVVVKDRVAALYDGSRQVGEAVWGESLRVSSEKDGWLFVRSGRRIKRRFVIGWIRRDSVIPYADSEKLYLSALKERPDDPLPPLWLSLQSVGKNESEQALLLADQAIRLAPKDPLPRLARAVALKAKGNLDGAAAECLAASAIDRRCAAAYQCLGRVRLEQKRLKEASDALTAAQELDPKDADIAESLALELYQQENFENAKKALDQAIRLDPQNADYCRHRAVVSWKLRNVDAAFRDVATAESMAPVDASVRDLSSDLLRIIGNVRKANEQALCACDFEPDVFDHYPRLIRTLQRDEPEVVLGYLSKWASQPPQTPAKLLHCADAYMICGKWTESLSLLNAALQLDSDCCSAILDCALLLGIQGQHEQAAQLLAASARLEPFKQQVPWPRPLFEPAAVGHDASRARSDLDSAQVLATFEQIANDEQRLFIPVYINNGMARLVLDTGAQKSQ